MKSSRECSYGYTRDDFVKHAEFPEHALPLLPKVCRDAHGRVDCAVIGGLYRPMANDLAKQDDDLRLRVSERWWCHNHAGWACRGNAVVQGRTIIDRMQAASDEVEGQVRPEGEPVP